jgi:predicted  nucleic acid-binding Zn-ribbon protein
VCSQVVSEEEKALTTVVETQTEPPTDSPTLSIVLKKTEDALASIGAQITGMHAQMARRHDLLDVLQVRLMESGQLVTHLAGQVQEAETKLSQAKTAAGVTKGTPAEKATAGNIKSLQAALATLQQQLQEAQLKHSTADTQTQVQTESIHKELAQDQAELAALEQSREQLEQVQVETAAALKQAVVREFEQELAQKEARIKELETELFDHKFEFDNTRYAIPVRFAQWPDLVHEMNARYGDKAKPVETPTQRVLKKYLALLEVLRVADLIVGTSTGTRPIQGALMRDLLAIPPHITDALLRGNPQAQTWLESRIIDIRDWWLAEHEAEAKSGRYVG